MGRPKKSQNPLEALAEVEATAEVASPVETAVATEEVVESAVEVSAEEPVVEETPVSDAAKEVLPVEAPIELPTVVKAKDRNKSIRINSKTVKRDRVTFAF